MLNKVRITTPDSLSPIGTTVHYVRDGQEDVAMTNVLSINIEISPASPVIAKVTMLITNSTIAAEAILSLESLKVAANFYGLELIDKACGVTRAT